MYQKNTEKLIFILPLLIFSVFIVGYWPVFQKVLIRWGGGDNSYCYLILPLFAYLLWEQRAKRVVKDYGLRDKDQGGRNKEPGLRIKEYDDLNDLNHLNDPNVPNATESFRFDVFSWSMWGLVPIILSILLIIIGELGSVETLIYIGIWGCAVGITFILYGWRIRHLVFPLVILLFIVPLPAFINRILTFQLKLAASKLSVFMLRITGVSVVREGNVIDLGISQLQVVDACSGLRYLMPLLLTALLVGYFFNKKLWQRAVLVLVVVPLSVFVNAVRIWLTGMLTVKGYEKLAQSFFHDFSGWLIYMIAGAVLVGLALFLKKISHPRGTGSAFHRAGRPTFTQLNAADSSPPREDLTGHAHTDLLSERPAQTKNVIASLESRNLNVPNDSNDLNDPNALNDINHPNQQWTRPVVLTIVLCLLFTASGWALKSIPSASNLPERMSFDAFPMQIGKWQGSRHFISQEILDNLWSDDYVSATFSKSNTANHINLLIPFYEYQGTRHTAHAPQACMLGSGWALFNSSVRQIDLNPHGNIKIMTMTWEKGDYKLLGSYFFFQRGRVITSPWMNKFYLMWDAFTKRRTDGALVRAEMTVAPGQSMDDAYSELEEFIADLWPILPKYIPK